jgi:hypothetical protein
MPNVKKNILFLLIRSKPPLPKFQLYPIIDRMSERLLSPEITLGSFDRSMPKQDLDLLQISAGVSAELGAGPAQIVGSELAETGLLGIAHHEIPDRLLIPDLVSNHHATFVDRPEQPAFGDAGSFGPEIDAGLHTGRDSDQAQALALTEEVGDDPAGFSLLQVFDVKA